MRVLLKKHNLPGRLVAVCGADGTGKSTALNFLMATLVERNDRGDGGLLRLRQPSAWWRSDPHVKSTLQLEGDAEVVDEFALGIFGVADRFNQQARVIEPALAAGHTVLVDRYVYCLLAYFMARNEAQLDHLTGMCQPLFQPDLTFVLDCPPEIAINRVVARDGSDARRSDQQMGATTKFIEAYRSLARSNDLYLVSSLPTEQAVSAEILEIFDDFWT